MQANNRQSIIDIAIAAAGNASAAFAIALLNGLSVTDVLTTKQEIHTTDVISQDIIDFLTNDNISPATASDGEAYNAIDVDSKIAVTVSDLAIKALRGQTWIDMAIQCAGNASAAFALSIANEVSLTDELIAGTLITLIDIVDLKTANYFTQNAIKPATGINIVMKRRIFGPQFGRQFT